MKIQSTITRNIYEFNPKGLGSEERHVCPECTQYRKNKKDRAFAWDANGNRGYCHHCNAAFFEFKPFAEKKEYFIPEWKNITELTDKAVKWFTGRKISQSTLNKLKVYSTEEYMPQFNKEVEVICFPYFVNSELKNIKYRGPGKSFKLVQGAEKVLFNLDSLVNSDYAIIVEGEIDCLSFIECGFDACVSVPNGASINLDYLDGYIHYFDTIEKIYIATDQDAKGLELRDELIRRIGIEKCYLINFKDCKDANQYLETYSNLEFKELLQNSLPVPVKGIVNAKSIYSDVKSFFEQGIQKGSEIGIDEIDKYISWELRRLAIVSGRPGSGKSEFVDFIITKLNLKFGWKAAYFTPENFPLQYHYAKLYEKLIGKKFHKDASSDVEFDMAMEYINDNFYYILDEENFTLESILSASKHLIKHKGIKILVIDPYNKIDHQIKSSESETNYISHFLDKLIMFGKLNNILIFLVAHPKKMQRGEIPSLYDISGSAHFYNKTDYGFTVDRELSDENIMTGSVNIHWQKIKFKHLGEQGISRLLYNYTNGRYEIPSSEGIHGWDNSNWIINTFSQNNDDLLNSTDEVPF